MSKILLGKQIGAYEFDASAQTVTLTGAGDFNLEDVLMITNVVDSQTIYVFNNSDFGGEIVDNVLTLSYDTTSMSDTDRLQIFVDYGELAYDSTLDIVKTIDQSPLWNRYTDGVSLISSAQNLSASFADLGYEIDCRGYNTIGLWLKCTWEESQGIQVKALAKHTVGGTEEYDLPLELISGGVINVTTELRQMPDSINWLYVYAIKTRNIIPYIQFQARHTNVPISNGTIDTAYITKGYE